jgi:ABC-2 type transport system ATP-binding protein
VASLAGAVEVVHGERQTSVVARLETPVHDPAWEVHDLTLEEVVIAYLGRTPAGPEARPTVEVVA